jgi:adenylosuccinate synthase
LTTVRLCTGYRYEGRAVDILPFGADAVSRCEPVYQEFAGWSESTFGVRTWSDLPGRAQAYLNRLSELAGVPIDLISTGPERDQTIVLRHPFSGADPR